MCIYTTCIYSCRHESRNVDACNHRQRRNKSKTGRIGDFLRLLICHSRLPDEKVTHTLYIKDICKFCKEKQSRRNERHRDREMAEKATQSEVKKNQHLKRQRSQRETQRRLNFFCSTCMTENRHRYPSSLRAREANNGLCCARGIDEYEDKYGVHNNPSTRLSLKHGTNENELNQHGNGGRLPVENPSIDEEARHSARSASMKFGWEVTTRDSLDLDPKLVSNFINVPGNNPYSLPPETHPPQKPLPQPPAQIQRPAVPRRSSLRLSARVSSGPRQSADIATQAKSPATPKGTPIDPTCIDWGRWDRAPQTYHGRWPSPSVAPSDPLPQRPLRHTKGRLSDYSQTRKNERPAYDGEDYPPFSPVSPLEDSRLEKPLTQDGTSISPISPLQQLGSAKAPPDPERVADNLEWEINQAINCWSTAGSTFSRKPLHERR